jgi:ketosteroid isomerase-like protein
MNKLLLTITLLMAGSFICFAENADEKKLIELDKEWARANSRGDRAALNRIYSDDFKDKSGAIDEAVNGAADVKNVSHASDNYDVRFVQPDLAIMTHFASEKGRYKGKDYVDYHHSLHVWAKRNGNWQVIATQVSPLSDEETIMQLEKEWAEAGKRRDTAWMEHNYAEEYTWTSPTGKLNDKKADIAEAKDLAFDSFDISEVKVRVLGDTAVATGLSTIKGKLKQQDISGKYRWTDTFVKRDGRWLIFASQSSPVGEK